MFGSQIFQSIDVSSYPSNDPIYNEQIEFQVYQKLLEGVELLQKKFTSLPSGETDSNNPFFHQYPLSSTSSSTSTNQVNKSNVKIPLGSINLLTHSHLVTYGGK